MKIVVIGAGHAGIEAAYAAAKMDADVTLVTIQLESIAQMSCNPSIGGVAKGHLVKEIDALGGIMPRAADRTGIHFKVLNRSKGPAVQASRSQNDKVQYRLFMKDFLEKARNIRIFQGIVTEIVEKNGKVRGIRLLDGEYLDADALVVTTGTFLNGRIFIGDTTYAAGRANEIASTHLAQNLIDLGFKTLRLKTGTPMRLHADTIDWEHFTPQPGDEPPVPFSVFTRFKIKNQIQCYIGNTTPQVKKVILDHLDLSPLYSGKIKGIGPRYCPSIEDKMVKFPDKETHHFFLEPEGLQNKEIYVNGLSTSLPVPVQREILHAIRGLANAKMTRPAYAVEYDAIIPTQLSHNLESRSIRNLFFAGQINGTSGYEEAAAQGIIAGINAVLKWRGEEPFVPGRDEAYIGVLVDDLVSKGVDEPYRLFTSRAEYRLQLREDNAFERLGNYAHQYGLITPLDFEQQMKKIEKRVRLIQKLKKMKVHIQSEGCSLFQLLKRPEYTIESLKRKFSFSLGEKVSQSDVSYVEANIKYSGYIDIQNREVEKNRELDNTPIPSGIDFFIIPGLSTEVRQKLKRINPRNFGEARRIPGITPAAIKALSIFLTLFRKKGRRV